jgi:Glyoxalase-like domain
MKEINHLVLAGQDLDALRETYGALGFTLCPCGQHPFGTGNTVIQLERNYLELLAVTKPDDVIEHTATGFSFSAFNRDFLARHEGFSMMVLGTENAHADIDRWKAAGLRTYDPFEFSRPAKLVNGDEVKVGFSLAFVSNSAAPWLGTFACQHFMPGYYTQPEYQRHANTAITVADVWITGDGAENLAGYFQALADSSSRKFEGRREIPTNAGTIVLASQEAFEHAFGVAPPHQADGPRLAALTIACRSLDFVSGLGLTSVGDRLVLPPERCFGTTLAFRRG